MTAATVLVVGDTSFDTTVLVDQVPAPDEKVRSRALTEDVGGVAANSAVAATVAGVTARLETTLGADAAGRECLRRLQVAGVETHAEHNSDRTARALVVLDAQGEKRLILTPGSTFYPDEQRCRTLDLDGVAWVHTAVYDIDAAHHLVDRCSRANIPWSVDLEPATFDQGLASLASVLDGAATVFCNSRAAALLGPHAANQLLEAGVSKVIMTCGAAGAELVTDEASVHIDAPRTVPEIVDTTGAGDCLAGSFVARTLLGDPAADALAYAVSAASLSCAWLGTHRTYPKAAAVRAALNHPTRRQGAVGS